MPHLVIQPVEVAECLQVLTGDREPETFTENFIEAAPSEGPADLQLHGLEKRAPCMLQILHGIIESSCARSLDSPLSIRGILLPPGLPWPPGQWEPEGPPSLEGPVPAAPHPWEPHDSRPTDAEEREKRGSAQSIHQEEGRDVVLGELKFSSIYSICSDQYEWLSNINT